MQKQKSLFKSKYVNKRYKFNGKEYSYAQAHYWIKNRLGKADHCSNAACLKRSVIFEWSNVSHKYMLDEKDWKQLCRSCHIRTDLTQKGKEFRSKRAMGNKWASNSRGKLRITSHSVYQYSLDNKCLDTYDSLTQASLFSGVSTSSISNCISGRIKTAGGFIWKYIDTNKTS